MFSQLYYKSVQIKTTLNCIWRSNYLEDCFPNSFSEYCSKPHCGWWVSAIQNLVMPRSEVNLRKTSTSNHFHLETWLDPLFFGAYLVGLFFGLKKKKFIYFIQQIWMPVLILCKAVAWYFIELVTKLKFVSRYTPEFMELLMLFEFCAVSRQDWVLLLA